MLVAKVFCRTLRASRKRLPRHLGCTRFRKFVVHAHGRHGWKRFDPRRLDNVRFPRQPERFLVCYARKVGAGCRILRPDRPLQNPLTLFAGAAVERSCAMGTNDRQDSGSERQGKIAPRRCDFVEAAIYGRFAVRFGVRSLI